MAQSSGIGQVLPLVLLGGAAWFVYEMFFANPAAATPVTPTTPVTPATPAAPASSTPPIVIPAGFAVSPDVNNSWKGTVTFNGTPTAFNLIFAGGAPTGQVFNSAGQDVTGILGQANVTTLVNAFQSAANVYMAQGGSVPAGMGQVIRVPMMLRRMRGWA